MEFLQELNRRVSDNRQRIEEWVNSHHENILIPLYSSADLRVSDFKISTVDTNVFPAGFNNLSEEHRQRAGELFRNVLVSKYNGVKKILIVPELHTKNRFYWQNVEVLCTILENAGYEVRVGVVSDDFTLDEAFFESASGRKIKASRVFKKGNRVMINGYDPDAILINNDFSDECPNTLRDIEQPVVPPVEIGWHTRRKDIHFDFYNKLAHEVSSFLDIDPWTISVDTRFQSDVDFDDAEDRARVAEVAGDLLDDMEKQYSRRGIGSAPHVFIKSNSGTYGMAVISTSEPDEIINLNSEGRKRMRVKKGNIPVRDIVIQEAIPTSITVGDDLIAEPVIYIVETEVAGYFHRTNSGRTGYENLNSRGMGFSSVSGKYENDSLFPPAYEMIAKIAAVAAGYEIEKIIAEGGCGE